jgi:hypothetical protein
MVDYFIEANGHPGGLQWNCIQKWCLIASQAEASRKIKVFLNTSPIMIKDEEFDRWVGNMLNIALGPRPTAVATGVVALGAGVAGLLGINQQALDYLALFKLHATTIGSNRPSVHKGGYRNRRDRSALATNKDKDHIAKMKDACGVFNT